jgi:hypothetical protein
MNLELARKIADAVLYEGYILYPYRAQSVKNRQRFNFGVLMPRRWAERQQAGDSGRLQTECLVEGSSPQVDIRVRFLQLISRQVAQARAGDRASGRTHYEAKQPFEYEVVPALEIDGEIHQTWEEAVEREIVSPPLNLAELASTPRALRWNYEADEATQPLLDRDGRAVGAIIRRRGPLEACVTISAERLGDDLWKVRVEVENRTPMPVEASRPEAQLGALASAHVLLAAQSGKFISLLDPPQSFASAVAGCRNAGVWPVLVGTEGERDLMLASPIILYDYPQIAPESGGDFCDGTEIDEMLALRVMTLTDDEKRAMRSVDRRAREILERTETLAHSSLMHLHGTIRGLREVSGS